MTKSMPAPKGLCADARNLWESVASDYELDGPGFALLREACLALNRLREAQHILMIEGIVTKDRFGQVRQHPATLVERDSRNALIKCLSALHLDFDPEAAVGAPAARI